MEPARLEYSTPQRLYYRKRFWVAVVAIAIAGLVVTRGHFFPVRAPPRMGDRMCAYGLKRLGMALLLYANEHHNKYPDDLDQLLLFGGVDTRDLICPHTKDSPATGPTTQQVIKSLHAPGHLSFVYCGKDMSTLMSPEAVVAYEPANIHPPMGPAFLFADGHVEAFSIQEGQQMVDQIKTGHNPPQIPK